MKRQKRINLKILKRLIGLGVLPNPIDLEDFGVLCCLIKTGSCNLEYLLDLSQDEITLWRKNFIQIKVAVTNQDNIYFTGIDVQHDPEEEEEVLHFARCGGAKDFCGIATEKIKEK